LNLIEVEIHTDSIFVNADISGLNINFIFRQRFQSCTELNNQPKNIGSVVTVY